MSGRHGPFPLGYHNPGKRHPIRLGDGVPENGVNVPAGIAIGPQEVAAVVVDRVDGIRVHELLHAHGGGTIHPDALEILDGEGEVMALLIFVALDRISPGQLLLRAGIHREHFHPVAGLRIDHVEPDGIAFVLGSVERHRATMRTSERLVRT